MWNLNRSLRAVAPLALVGLMAACEQEGATSALTEPTFASFDSTFATSTSRTFVQIERLGNPLTSEVFVEKREHPTFNVLGPDRDPGHFTDDIQAFVTQVAGRNQTVANTIAAVLLGTSANPGDKLTVLTGRAAGVTATTAGAAANVGWLTHVLDPNNGYGGRKLANDDVVDKGLLVTFGPILSPDNVSPGLTTDNVDSNDKAPLNTFPYFPEPTL